VAAVVGMIWKTNGSVVVLGADPGRGVRIGHRFTLAGVDPDGLLLGVVLARLWRPWVRSAVAGMIRKTDGSVVVLGADPDGGDGDLSAGMDPDRLLQQSSRFVNRAAGYQNGNRSSWRGCGAMGTLGGGRDDLEDGRQRRRPGRVPGGGDGDLSAGADPDRLLLGDVSVADTRHRCQKWPKFKNVVFALGGHCAFLCSSNKNVPLFSLNMHKRL